MDENLTLWKNSLDLKVGNINYQIPIPWLGKYVWCCQSQWPGMPREDIFLSSLPPLYCRVNDLWYFYPVKYFKLWSWYCSHSFLIINKTINLLKKKTNFKGKKLVGENWYFVECIICANTLLGNLYLCIYGLYISMLYLDPMKRYISILYK